VNDSELDAGLRAAVRYDPSRATGVFEDAGPDLLEEIMRTPDQHTTPSDRPVTPAAGPPEFASEFELPAPAASRPHRRRRGLVLAAVAAAVVVAVAVPARLFGDHPHQAAVTPAGRSLGLANSPTGSWVLPDEAGWNVAYVEQEAKNNWEVHLNRGAPGSDADDSQQEGVLSINAGPPLTESGVRSERHGPVSTTIVPVLGVRVPLDQEGENAWEVVFTARNQTLDLRGTFTRATFVDLLAKLRWVDTPTFDAAVPPDTVTPDRELTVAKQLLRGVPLPPGVSAADMVTGQTNNRYQFGAHVTRTVVCRWIQLDLRARATGDRKGRRTADSAMASSHQWPVLQEMKSQGGWSDEVWQYADALSKGTQVRGGTDQVNVANSYQQALGCGH
jgi:hypothetical protein